MKCHAVIGAQFGDEGKGKAVSHFCSELPNPLVIRFSGGQQAGHRVQLKNGLSHVHSNFGSGTLQGEQSYFNNTCTIDPFGIRNEYSVLESKGITPTLFIDDFCPVTTVFDKSENEKFDKLNKHGSCRVGVGQTYQREEDNYSLLFMDLFYPSVVKKKLRLIVENYYKYDINMLQVQQCIKEFEDDCEWLVNCNSIYRGNEICITDYENIIFEGSQGLLLDQRIGFFPHVSRGNFGLETVKIFLNDMLGVLSVSLVTRAYQTRHGNGPMTNEDMPHTIMPNPYEENPDDGAQGKFRIAPLDLDLLTYAIDTQYILGEIENKELIVTCLDCLNDYVLTYKGLTYTLKSETEFLEMIRTITRMPLRISKTPTPELEVF